MRKGKKKLSTRLEEWLKCLKEQVLLFQRIWVQFLESVRRLTATSDSNSRKVDRQTDTHTHAVLERCLDMRVYNGLADDLSSVSRTHVRQLTNPL